MSRKTGDKKVCIICGNPYADSSFYSHRNRLINEKFGFCKKCVVKQVELDDMDTLYDFLRTANIPYLKEFWKIANEADTETVGTYLKNLNSLKQNKELRFKDSDDINGKTNKAELVDISNENFELTDEIVKKWGRNLELEDYIFLEGQFDNLGGNQLEDTLQELLYKNIAKTQWMANEAYENGRIADYEKMMKSLSSQMADANIKPSQTKNANLENGVNSWSEWTKVIEETEPILEEERFEPKFIKSYIERFFVTQIKRVFGKIKDEDIKKIDGED